MGNTKQNLGFACPYCPNETIASSSYQKSDLETALDVGEIMVAHITCGNQWKNKLSPKERENIKRILQHMD